MGLFNNQFANVIEWNETRDDVMFWMWRNKEIKKGSRLIIRPGQDAIFLYNGKIEGVFTDEGNYEMESEIIPFLTSLKGFKFGFNTPLRAEVLFINTKEFLVRWGTKNAINIPTPALKGGMPIRSFGTFTVKIDDHQVLIDKIAGIKQQFTIDDVKDRTLSMLDQLLMRWISKEGKDLFNLQANAYDIARGIRQDLDMDLIKIGLTVTDFTVASFTYPENIQKMVEKNASFDMVSDIDKYQKVSMIDSMASNPNSQMAGMAQAGVGMAMGVEMMKQMG
ncbi:MAG: SPFH domain-containing protein, partial [Turicibacter sp.]